MAGQSTGVNEGVAGSGSSGVLVTIDGVGALFAVEMGDGFAAAFKAALLENTGRGDAAGDKTFRFEDADGSWRGAGRCRSDKRPLPLFLAAASGTVRLTAEAAGDLDGNVAPVCYLQFAALFQSITFTHTPSESGGENVWTVAFTCVKSGPLTQGWRNLDGTVEAALCALPAAGTLTGHATHKQLLAGLSKTYDVLQSLTGPSSATQNWDAVGVANTDAAEAATLMAVIAAAIAAGAPFPDGVLAQATLQRTGGIGARIRVAWDLDAAKLGCTTRGSNDYEIARVNAGNVQVYVAEKRQRSNAGYVLILGQSRARRTTRHLTITRKITSTTVPDHQDLVETVNAATFLGLAAKSVLYLGADVQGVVPAGSVSRTWLMVYHFLWVANGHFTLDGWRGEVPGPATATAAAWNDVSGLTGSGLTATQPDDEDFSVFTA